MHKELYIRHGEEKQALGSREREASPWGLTETRVVLTQGDYQGSMELTIPLIRERWKELGAGAVAQW